MTVRTKVDVSEIRGISVGLDILFIAVVVTTL